MHASANTSARSAIKRGKRAANYPSYCKI